MTNTGLGYKPSSDALALDLHELLSLFYSSEKIGQKLRASLPSVHQAFPIEKMEEATATKLLLSTAVTLRVMHDQARRSGTEANWPAADCGSWQQPNDPKKMLQALPLREACNKIIHATEVCFTRIETDLPPRPLDTCVYLEGSDQKGNPWRVNLSIWEYVQAGMQSALQHYVA
jgi:hypothetical protein